MIDKVLSDLSARWDVTPRDVGKYATVNKSGMRFTIRAWDIAGVGGLSAVSMTAMLGLMKMETVVLTPLEKDAPLLSYDLIHAMGKDTLLLEMYDTQLAPADVAALDAVKARYVSLADHALGERWYDSIRLSPSLSKRGKGMGEQYRGLCAEYWDEYLRLLGASAPCDREAKQARVRQYVDGLLNNGGPSTDQFVKLIGKDDTRELFGRFIFSSEN